MWVEDSCELLETFVVWLLRGVEWSACHAYLGFQTSFCMDVGEVDVEIAAVCFLCCRWIGDVGRNGATTSFPLCVTALIYSVLSV